MSTGYCIQTLVLCAGYYVSSSQQVADYSKYNGHMYDRFQYRTFPQLFITQEI